MQKENNTGVYEPQRDFEQKVTHILLYDTEVNPHFHGSIEILLVKKGKVEYCSNLHSHILSEGEIVFIPPFFSHSFRSLTESETETIIIPSSYLKDYDTYLGGLYFSKLSDRQVNIKIENLFKEIEKATRSENCNDLMLKGLVNYLLGFIAANYPASPYKRGDNLMVNIALYINDNFTHKITLEEISSHFGFNKTYFSRLFKKYFNCSLTSFVNNIRYNYVIENKGNNNITTLIHEVGFVSTSSFYRYSQQKKEKKNE